MIRPSTLAAIEAPIPRFKQRLLLVLTLFPVSLVSTSRAFATGWAHTTFVFHPLLGCVSTRRFFLFHNHLIHQIQLNRVVCPPPSIPTSRAFPAGWAYTTLISDPILSYLCSGRSLLCVSLLQQLVPLIQTTEFTNLSGSICRRPSLCWLLHRT